MRDIQELVDQFFDEFGQHDDNNINTLAVHEGIVVDVDDPLEMGRLRVFCPALNDNPKKLQHIPWAAYVSPFGGSIKQPEYTRGHEPGKTKSSGPVQYGFWSIPEMGAHVLVICIGGDVRKRAWIGSLPEHQEVNTLPHGKFKWKGGGPDGPLTSDGSPIKPLYDNMKEAFGGDVKGREWKTRGADYQACAVTEEIGDDPNGQRTNYVDDQYKTISSEEEDKWVKPILGANGYDWTGFKNLGPYKSPRVYSWTTPGFHSISMDDRPFNSRMRFRTTSGHQIILDDTNERIYISTYKGKTWVEMDVAGNIDVFAERRISIHGMKDINITSDETVRIKGNKGVHIYAGDTRGQTPLDAIPADGQLRLQSADDMHVYTGKTHRHYSGGDMRFEATGNLHILSNEYFQHSLNGTYMYSEVETFLRTPQNALALFEDGYSMSTNLDMAVNVGKEYVLAANMGNVLDTNPYSLMNVSTDNEEILGVMGDSVPFGIWSDCITPNGPLFKLDLSNINLQSKIDTYLKSKVRNFSKGFQGLIDKVDDFASKYNSTVATLTENVSAVNSALSIIKTVTDINNIADLGTIVVPTLPTPDSILGNLIGNVSSLFGVSNILNLGLPNLCVQGPPVQLTYAYDFGGITLQLGDDVVFGGSNSAALPSDAEFAVWPNRVPQHESWPRVLMQDSDDTVNTMNDGYKNNVDWVEQYDNKTSPEGLQPIGVVEGDETLERNQFWRR